jgi:hypothetical protein
MKEIEREKTGKEKFQREIEEMEKMEKKLSQMSTTSSSTALQVNLINIKF